MSFAVRTFSVLLLLALCPACGGSTAKPAGEPAAKLGSPGDGGSSDWTLIRPCSPEAPDDPIEIKSLELEGDTLTIGAGHSAGCAEHTYGLCYEKLWAESYPVQIGLRLMHDAHGEQCESYEMRELEFDLSPLAEAYNKAYQSDGGSIILSLVQKSVLYTFGPPRWEQIEAALDAANTCDVVTDCRPLSTKTCQTVYVSASADTTDVEEMIAEYNQSESGDDNIACAVSCACGVLSCSNGKCVTAAGTCDATLPPELVAVCL